MSKRDYKLYFEDILESINKIEGYIHGMTYKDFIRDKKTIDAVLRNLEVIGEAARQVPQFIKSKYHYIGKR